uniref:Uncharacterized protein n=1 Tax=Anguilla anguilla TaxID=7936 RepID=A0A0E9UCE7_ANGAN
MCQCSNFMLCHRLYECKRLYFRGIKKLK